MKIQTHWSGLQKIGRTWIQHLMPNLGTVVLVLMLLWMTDFVGAAPWSIETQTPTSDREFTLPYQGRLTDAPGNPIDNIAPGIEMTFALYTQKTGGIPIWGEHYSGVPVSDGLFNVYLGSITPLDPALFDDDLWIGVTIENDSEMTPREKVVPHIGEQSTSVPVGTVISWWRPDASTPLPSDKWAIVDGSVVTDSDSPLYNQTLPDLTNRFIMGVTTTDIGQTGGTNALDLTHSHSMPAHQHNVNGTTGEIHGMWDGGYHNAESEPYRYAINTYKNTWYTRHNHSLNIKTSSWSGNTNEKSLTTDNRPEYVGLIFLIRIK
jgi:hypothetical protein